MSDVYLYVYDLSKGLAKSFSALFLGKHFDGVWHTGVVGFGREWYFGNDGIDCCAPKGTVLGEPNEIIHLGKTDLSESDFLDVINQMRQTSYRIGTYNLLEHNCNNFSNELSQILIGREIPKHIIDLPKEILNTPLGPIIKPLLEQAADPIHQYRASGTIFSHSDNYSTSQMVGSISQKNDVSSVEYIPSTVITYNSDNFFMKKFENSLDELVLFCNEKKLLNENENELLIFLKNYLEIGKKKSLENTHIRLLFDLYFNLIKTEDHHLTIIKMLKEISLHNDVAQKIIRENFFKNVFVPKLKSIVKPELKLLCLQMISNLLSHKAISQYVLENYQDIMFEELSEFTLIEAKSDIEFLIHESCISLFFNLISAYHLEKYLNEGNSLRLGVALLERLPKLKSKAKTVYQMLSLLRSCLTISQDVRNLAEIENFDLKKYALNMQSNSDSFEPDSKEPQNDTYETIIQNIDDMLNIKNDGN